MFSGEPDHSQGADDGVLVREPVLAGPVRSIEFADLPDDRFFSRHIHLSDEVIVYLSGNAPARLGPPPHAHPVDQYFYQLEGELELELGQDAHRLVPGSWAHIPAGTPHKHRNPDPDKRELHLEVMAPGFDMATPFMQWAGDPSGWRAGGTVVTPPPRHEWKEMGIGNRSFVLSDPSGSLDPAVPESTNIATWYTYSQPGSALNAVPHIHAFTQFYYVIEGQLGVDIALDSFVAGPHTLVVIPPGVPHRNHVVGDEAELHVQINVPPPLSARGAVAWDVPVHLERA